jgi:hypothetical protein
VKVETLEWLKAVAWVSGRGVEKRREEKRKRKESNK